MLRISTTFGAIALATALISTSAMAEEGSFRTKQAGQFNIRARILTALPSDGQNVLLNGSNADSTYRARVSDDVVPELDISYFITDNIAVEAIAGWTRHVVKATAPNGAAQADLGSVRLLPPTITGQYHFFTKERISPYVGAGWNYSFLFGEKNANGTTASFSNATGPAIQAGVDIAIVGGLSLNLDVKKIWWIDGSKVASNFAGGVHSTANLDPLLVGVGVGYRF